MKKKIEIEQAENGYSVRVWKPEEDDSDEYGYVEPKTYVASDEEEVMKLVKDCFKGEK